MFNVAGIATGAVAGALGGGPVRNRPLAE